MLVICAGMFRSGSTWQYQVARELLLRAGRKHEAKGFLVGPALAKFLAQPRAADTTYVYKTHAPSQFIHSLLDPADVRVLYSYRDLRDVVYSYAYKHGIGFRDAVTAHRVIEKCLAIDAHWSQWPGALTQRYKDWVVNNAPFVRGIADLLNVDLPDEVLERVTQEFTIARNQERTAQLTRNLVAQGFDLDDPRNMLRQDAESLLHWNHIRSGTVGQWKSLATREELDYLARTCGDWLIARGYETDRSWATTAVAESHPGPTMAFDQQPAPTMKTWVT